MTLTAAPERESRSHQHEQVPRAAARSARRLHKPRHGVRLYSARLVKLAILKSKKLKGTEIAQ